jgi:hypothetical protein
MSDNKRGLPVRTQEDPDLKVQVKNVDYTNPSQGQTIDTDGNGHVEVHGNQPTTNNDVVLQLSEEGRVNSGGDYDAVTNTKPASSAPIMHDRKNTAETPSETDQNLRPTGVTYDNGVDETIVAQDVAIRDENGVPYSKDNPLSVTLEESKGEEKHEYFEHIDVTADGGTSETTFTINDGEVFLLDQVLCDGSVAHKMTLEIGDGGATEVFAKKAVRFASEVNDNADVELKRPIKIIGTANGTTVKVTVENRDKHDDVSIYTTIVGVLFN